MISRLRLFGRGILLAVVPLLCQIACIVWLACQLWHIQNDITRGARATTLGSATHLLVLTAVQRVYWMSASGGPDGMLDPSASRKAITQTAHDVVALAQLAKYDPDQVPNLQALARALNELIGMYQWAMVEQSRGPVNWKKVNDTGSRGVLTATKHFISAAEAVLSTEESKEKLTPMLIEQSRSRIRNTLMLAIPGSLLVSALLGYFYVISIRGPILRISENSRRLSKHQPLLPTLASRDEFGSLDSYLHKVALSIEETIKKDREMVKNAVDMICSLDQDLVFISVNPYASNLLSVNQDQLVGRSILDFICVDDIAKADEQFTLCETSAEATVIELRLLKADGSLLETRCSILWSGTQKNFVCVIHDVTEEKNVERLKDDFAKMISHDLTSPLTSMFDATSLIAAGAMGQISQEISDEIDNANRNIARIISFVNEVLDFQKLSAGKMPVELALIEIVEPIRAAVDLVQRVADDKLITIFAPSTGIIASCDCKLITQVVMNYLSNAIKFAPAQTTVRVEATELFDSIEIAVTDHGPGVAHEFREKIFQAYEQLPEGQSKHGTGLGLAICKLIVESHGGTVGVRDAVSSESEYQSKSGSTFWLRLPKHGGENNQQKSRSKG
jgi:PAS domain S-box-containing protein